jgi:hypothetical protein
LLLTTILWVPGTRIPRSPSFRLRVGRAIDRVDAVAGRSQGVVLSLAYWSLRRLLELVVLRRRSEREKEIEILLLRHQLRVLERQIARPRLTPADRALLAASAALLRWHRELVARRWTYPVGFANSVVADLQENRTSAWAWRH